MCYCMLGSAPPPPGVIAVQPINVARVRDQHAQPPANPAQAPGIARRIGGQQWDPFPRLSLAEEIALATNEALQDAFDAHSRRLTQESLSWH